MAVIGGFQSIYFAAEKPLPMTQTCTVVNFHNLHNLHSPLQHPFALVFFRSILDISLFTTFTPHGISASYHVTLEIFAPGVHGFIGKTLNVSFLLCLQKNLRMAQRLTWKGKKQRAVTKNNKLLWFQCI